MCRILGLDQRGKRPPDSATMLSTLTLDSDSQICCLYNWKDCLVAATLQNRQDMMSNSKTRIKTIETSRAVGGRS